jgi:hypothetical protein
VIISSSCRGFACATFALLLAFRVAASASEPTVAWRKPLVIASGAGERGEWRQNESQWNYVDDPSVALYPDGDAAVVWVDQRRKDVFFQRYDANGKPARAEQPVNISRTPAVFSWLPRIALSAERPNDTYVLWQEIVFSGGSHGGDIFFARSTDGGATFGEPMNLSRSIGGDGKGRTTASDWDNGSLDLAVGPNGTIYVAWTEYHGALWFSRSGDAGESFRKPERVAGDDTRPARAPALAIAPDGTVYLAWTTGEDPAADIHVARLEKSAARFSEPIVAAQTRGYSDAPKLAVDSARAVHLVYGERDGAGWRRAEIHYTRSIDGGRSFSAPRAISSPAPGDSALAAFPSLAVDRQGHLYCSWELYRSARAGGRGLGFTVSRDGGQTFTAPAVIPGSIDPDGGVNGSNQGKLMRKLAVSSAGRPIVVNSSLRQGAASRVWLIRGE